MKFVENAKKRKKSQILHFLSFLRRCNSSNIQYFALKIELLVVLHHISLKTKAQVSIKILEKVILRWKYHIATCRNIANFEEWTAFCNIGTINYQGCLSFALKNEWYFTKNQNIGCLLDRGKRLKQRTSKTCAQNRWYKHETGLLRN